MLASQRVKRYVSRMINNGTWPVNTRLPHLNSISRTLQVSTSTVRRVIGSFERCGIIEHYSGLGYYVLLNIPSSKRSYIRIQSLLSISKKHLHMANFSKTNVFGDYMISYSNNIITAINRDSNVEFVVPKNELITAINTPITVSEMLKINDNERLTQLRELYNKQQKIKKLARIVKANRKTLGIEWKI